VVLGYRDFHAHWANGTELHLTDGWLDGRLGLGADIRLARWLSLSPMATIGGGSFGTVEWKGDVPQSDMALDDPGQHTFFGLHVGAHVSVD
jgi:hypothetical protein